MTRCFHSIFARKMAAMPRRDLDAGRSRKGPSLPARSRLFLLATVLLGSLLACDICSVAVHVSATTLSKMFQKLTHEDTSSPYFPEFRVFVKSNPRSNREDLYLNPEKQEGACGIWTRDQNDYTLFSLPMLSLRPTPVEKLRTPEGLAEAIKFKRKMKLNLEDEVDYPVRVLPLHWISESLERGLERGPECTVQDLINEITLGAKLFPLIKGVPKVLDAIVPHMKYLIETSAVYAKVPVGEREEYCKEIMERKPPSPNPKCVFPHGLWSYFQKTKICEASKIFLCAEFKAMLKELLQYTAEQRRKEEELKQLNVATVVDARGRRSLGNSLPGSSPREGTQQAERARGRIARRLPERYK